MQAVIDETVTITDKLQLYTEDVGKVTDIIKDISGQTNLLALPTQRLKRPGQRRARSRFCGRGR